MGMFDWIRFKTEAMPPEHREISFQTKDTPEQSLLRYEVREDGSLWCELVDYEDRSDPTAEGWNRFAGMLTPVNRRWEPQENFIGELRVYGTYREMVTDDGGVEDAGWVEYSSYFVKGQLTELHVLRDEKPENE